MIDSKPCGIFFAGKKGFLLLFSFSQLSFVHKSANLNWLAKNDDCSIVKEF